MKIKHLENGSVEVTNENGTLVLSRNDVEYLRYNFQMKYMKDIIIDRIESFEEWCFEQSKADILTDTEFIEEMAGDALYNGITLYDGDDAVYDFLDQYLDVKYDEE